MQWRDAASNMHRAGAMLAAELTMGATDLALIAAGVLGAGVALIHGALMQRYMVKPIERLLASGAQMNTAAKKLTPILLHLTTLYWFAGGVALIAAAFWFDESAKVAIATCVAFMYACAAIGNFAGTRGRHPGWALYAISVALIIYGVAG